MKVNSILVRNLLIIFFALLALSLTAQSAGTFDDFLTALRNFESGVDPAKAQWYADNYNNPIINYPQIHWPGEMIRDAQGKPVREDNTIKEWFQKLGIDHLYDPASTDPAMFRAMQYASTNAFGFIGYQLGEGALVETGYYIPARDDQGHPKYYCWVDDATWANGVREKLMKPYGEADIVVTHMNTWQGAMSGKNGVNTLADLKDPEKAELVIRDWFQHIVNDVEKRLAAKNKTWDDVIGKTLRWSTCNPPVASPPGGRADEVVITLSGILAGSHLRGPGGLVDLIVDENNTADEFGTYGLMYVQDFGGFDTIYDTPLNDVISGSGYNENLSAGMGSDTIITGGGNDKIYLSENPQAVTTINDFVIGESVVICRGFSTALNPVVTDVAGEATITFSNGQKVILKGISGSQAQANLSAIVAEGQIYEIAWSGAWTVVPNFNLEYDIIRGINNVGFSNMHCYLDAEGDVRMGVVAADGGIYTGIELQGIGREDLHSGMFRLVGDLSEMTQTVYLSWSTNHGAIPWGHGAQVTVNDFDTDTFKVNFSTMLTSFSALRLVKKADGTTVIDMNGAEGGKAIILPGVDPADMTADNFLGCSGTFDQMAYFDEGNSWPVSTFSASTVSGYAPVNVSFDGTGSTDADGTIASYAWDFGDGTTAVGASASRNFTVPGEYEVSLTVTDNIGAPVTSTQVISVLETGKQYAPNAVFTAVPVAGSSPLTVSFDGNASSDVDGTIVEYRWEFGDGTFAYGPTATHTYVNPYNDDPAVIFTAALIVTDNHGLSHGTTEKIKVSFGTGPVPPSASLSATPTQGDPNLNVTFTGSGVAQGGATITGYSLDFGDNSPASTNPSDSHIYTAPGNYTATLTVTDSNGMTGSDSVVIKVNAPAQPPTAVAGADKTTVYETEAVTFDGSLSTAVAPATITGYAWDFGDSTTGTGVSPSHSYTAAGTYTATLTVTDSNGLTDTDSVQIIVNTPPPGPTAVASAAPTTVEIGETVNFDGTGSTAVAPASITGYSWNFDDNSTGTGAQTTHAYAAAGTYTVVLTVTDSNQLTDTASVIIIVNEGPQPPTAAVTADPVTGPAPLAVTFNASGSTAVSPATISSYSWDFGDGSPAATGVQVAHTYTVAGSYTATVTVTDSNGLTDSASVTITATGTDPVVTVLNWGSWGWASTLTINNFDPANDILDPTAFGYSFAQLGLISKNNGDTELVLYNNGGYDGEGGKKVVLVGVAATALSGANFTGVSGSFADINQTGEGATPMVVGWGNWGWAKHVTFTDFDPAANVIDMSAFNYSFSQLVITQSGADAVITLAGGAEGGKSITLTGVTASVLTAAHFLF